MKAGEIETEEKPTMKKGPIDVLDGATCVETSGRVDQGDEWTGR